MRRTDTRTGKTTRTSNLGSNELMFDKDIPWVKRGLALDQVWFSGGRTALTILRHGGIGEILHYGRQAQGLHTFFKSSSPQSSFSKIFRLCVVIDGVSHYPEFNDTRIYPFGYTSECTLAEVTFRHELTVLNDAVVQRIAIRSNPARKKLALRLVLHGFCGVTSPHRKWGAWEMDEAMGGLCTSATDSYTEEECRRQVDAKKANIRLDFAVSDVPYAETHIGAASSLKAKMISANNGFKYYLNTEDFADQAAFFLVFNSEQEGLAQRVRELRSGFSGECDRAAVSYRERLSSSPKIKIAGAAAAQSCMVGLPPMIDSVEAKDIPGGFRAATHGYWIWLDLFFNSSAFTYANDASSLLDMLKLFRSFAVSTLGMPKLVTTELKPLHGAEWVEQALYVTAFYHYYCGTGDIPALREIFPFLAWLTDKCLEKEAAGTGLLEGIGMPDFPMDMDGHDICSSGNSIFYQAIKVMEVLAMELDADEPKGGYAERAAQYRAIAGKCRTSFLRYFYDADKGYLVDSLSSRDFSRRSHYPVFAILWLTHFAADLLGDHAKDIAAFQSKNFTRPHGIGGMIPTWDSAYPGDGNQLLAYYPSWSEAFYRNTMRLAGRGEELEKWFDDVGWFWQQNTIPEGFTYDAENEGFTVDNPGTKQAFGGQAWYCVFFGAIVGLVIDEKGLILSRSPVRRRITVKGLVVRGKRLDITLAGAATGAGITVNGQRFEAPTVRFPFADLKKRNTIVIAHEEHKQHGA
jgi:hypothetical protein